MNPFSSFIFLSELSSLSSLHPNARFLLLLSSLFFCLFLTNFSGRLIFVFIFAFPIASSSELT